MKLTKNTRRNDLELMLSLHSDTSARWLTQVDEHLEDILIDHAHCEKKAAGTAMNLLFAYIEFEELAREMTEIVKEELEHFTMVLDLLPARGIEFCKQIPGEYGRKLHEAIRKGKPERAIDRLLVASLIEARSCERFSLLRDHIKDRDPELSEFYGSLFESEARHHTTYVRLAKLFTDEATMNERLAELAVIEAAIVEEGDPLPRMHS